MDDIRKCGISSLKLQAELPTKQLHDISAGKFPILIYSPESLYEESVQEHLLKLQKNNFMHSCRRRSLCVTVVSMKQLVVDLNRSAITNTLCLHKTFRKIIKRNCITTWTICCC